MRDIAIGDCKALICICRQMFNRRKRLAFIVYLLTYSINKSWMLATIIIINFASQFTGRKRNTDMTTEVDDKDYKASERILITS